MKKNNQTEIFNPFKGLVLDHYEQEIETNLGKNPKMTPPSKSKVLKLQNMAKNSTESIRKNKNINLRVSESTYLNLKAKALKLGIPYQTLASSILHQFSNR